MFMDKSPATACERAHTVVKEHRKQLKLQVAFDPSRQQHKGGNSDSLR